MEEPPPLTLPSPPLPLFSSFIYTTMTWNIYNDIYIYIYRHIDKSHTIHYYYYCKVGLRVEFLYEVKDRYHYSPSSTSSSLLLHDVKKECLCTIPFSLLIQNISLSLPNPLSHFCPFSVLVCRQWIGWDKNKVKKGSWRSMNESNINMWGCFYVFICFVIWWDLFYKIELAVQWRKICGEGGGDCFDHLHSSFHHWMLFTAPIQTHVNNTTINLIIIFK